MKQPNIAIIGAGTVGATTAYSLITHNIPAHLMLIDVNDRKCQGEVEDLADALSFSKTESISIGNIAQAGQADIAIISAGIPQKPGQPRSELLATNYGIITDILQGMQPLNPNLIIIMVTNPVDVLTYVAQHVTNLPKEQIFGSGTLLDSQRLRNLISKKSHIAPSSIDLYIVGEHGDNQCVAWSSATIAGSPLLEFSNISQHELEQMALQAKNKAYSIIACKGSTAFGIASCITTYCQNIVYDTQQIVPVSCYSPEYKVCLSLPAVLGQQGITQILKPPMNYQEQQLLDKSIAAIQHQIASLNL